MTGFMLNLHTWNNLYKIFCLYWGIQYISPLVSVFFFYTEPYDTANSLFWHTQRVTSYGQFLEKLISSYDNYSAQFSHSVVSLCSPMNSSTPGFPVHHQLLELAQTHVHWVSDAIQPSHPLSSPYPPAFSLSQHRGLFQWVCSSHQVAKVWSF